MFENLLRKYDEMLDEVRDMDRHVQIMVAEVQLLERLGKSKETLMDEMEKRQ